MVNFALHLIIAEAFLKFYDIFICINCANYACCDLAFRNCLTSPEEDSINRLYSSLITFIFRWKRDSLTRINLLN